MKKLLSVLCTVLLAGVVTSAQQAGSSPAGTAEIEIGGKWITISYGRPIKRGRELFGTGDAYATKLNAGAPVWRAGANVSTRLKTEAPLVIGDKPLPAGEYTMFIDLKPGAWTLIVSSWPAQSQHDPSNRQAIWGAFGYTSDKDVVRAPMTLTTLPFSMEELTWAFIDMTESGGKIALMWDKDLATASFQVKQGS